VTVKGEVASIGKFVAGVVERMNLGDFELTESPEGEFIIYHLSGDGGEDLVAGDGRAVDAIQLLANQAAMRADDDAPRIVVDVEGAGERREEALERLASRAAKRAIDTGRSIALDPMNGRNRRTLHMTIREIEGVATMSIGEGRYRQVLIVPEGAAEYDEAVAASSDA
jgi:spoIIIJ-associated protein